MVNSNDTDPFASLRPGPEPGTTGPSTDRSLNPSAATDDYRSLRPDESESAPTKDVAPHTNEAAVPLPSTAEGAPGVSVEAETGEYTPKAPDQELTGDYATPTRQTAAPIVRAKERTEGEELPEVPGYEILGVLGRGGMGVVYKARQQGLKRVVALKMIRDARLAGPSDLARFQIEAEAIAALHHPNIVQIYEIGAFDGLPYFSLEFVDGGNLGKTMARKPQPARWSAEMMETLARAMEAAHSQGIIHRDLKPANVLLTADGQPKVTDFGLAKQLEHEKEQTRTGDVMGTPNYMPPEQAQGRVKELGPVSDVWSLGVMLYEMLTGRLPFLGETMMDTFVMIATSEPVTPRKLQPKVPRDLETICLKCLEKDAHKRYATAGVMADDLRRWLNGEPIQARPASLVERGVKWTKRNKLRAAAYGLAACLLLSLLLGPAAYFYQQFQTEEKAKEAAQLRATELERAETERAEVRRLLDDGSRALEANKFREAGDAVLSAQNKIKTDKVLKDFEARANELADRIQRQRLAYDKFAAHRQPTSVAYFLNSYFTGLDAAENVKQLRAAVLAALKVYDWTEKTDPAVVRDDPFLGPEEKQELLENGSGLLLILARETLNEGTPEAAKQAKGLLENAANLREPGPAHHDLRALCLERLGDTDGAGQARSQAEQMKREMEEGKRAGNGSDYFLLGLHHYQKRQLSEAVSYFERALHVQKNYFWAQFYMGICFIRDGRPGEAKEILTACVDRRGDFIWNYLLRGLACGQLAMQYRNGGKIVEAASNFDTAEKDFGRAEALHPTENERYTLLTNRGVSRYYQKNWDGAIADLEKAIQLKPDRFQAYENLAEIFSERKNLDKAVEMLDKAIALKPPVLAALYRQRAKVDLKHKEYVAEIADLDNALKNEPKDSPYRHVDQVDRARAFFALKKYTDAVAACDKAIEADAKYPPAHQVRATALLELRRFEEAVAAYDEYLKYHKGPPGSNEVGIYEARGLARQTLRDPAGAIADFTRALAVDENNASARRLRGWAYLVTDVPRLALTDFQKVLDVEPDNADAYAGRGYARATLGNYSTAVADAEEALQRGPKDSRNLYNVCRIFAQSAGRIDEIKGRRDPGLIDIRARYQDRAVALLRDSVILLKDEDERAAFWHDYVGRDPALVPIRASSTFKDLDQKYGKTTATTDK